MSHIHIFAPPPTAKSIHTTICPDCKKRTRMLCFYTPWYGDNSTCLKCGREWAGGEWLPLTFERGARQKSIDHAKKLWRRLPPVSENHFCFKEGL